MWSLYDGNIIWNMSDIYISVQDYHHRLVYVTERERFEVPVRAIGPRAILDFRDELHLPLCAVKGSAQRTQLVRNVGNSKAKFTLHAQRLEPVDSRFMCDVSQSECCFTFCFLAAWCWNPFFLIKNQFINLHWTSHNDTFQFYSFPFFFSPFTVTPSSGNLDVGEGMQVTVDFHPTTVGEHHQDLLLHYHTGRRDSDTTTNLYHKYIQSHSRSRVVKYLASLISWSAYPDFLMPTHKWQLLSEAFCFSLSAHTSHSCECNI